MPRRLAATHARIIACDACPRLRDYCLGIATTRRAAFRDETYWARPVPGFGDARARLLVLGLAPAAHGANRTGRVFTGDGVNGSGDFLMRAMKAAGFANRATSHRPDDGLVLTDAYIAAAVRCAPPDNTPTPDEVDTCLAHLEAELAALTEVRLVVVLGRIAYDAYRRLARRRGVTLPAAPFAHGHFVNASTLAVGRGGSPSLDVARDGLSSGRRPSRSGAAPALPNVLQSYHPSRQNTHTGRLTDTMLASVFIEARRLIELAA